MTAYEFIVSEIDKTTKLSCEGDNTLIPLPYPFTVPCVKGAFPEMYYWDTYFTNKCLYLTGRKEQALNNVKNLAYMLEAYGKIPNGNRTHYLGRSQPPFFGMMLADLLQSENFAHGISLETAYNLLQKEYSFWETESKTVSGLNAYGCDFSDEEALGTFGVYTEVHTEKYCERTGIPLENTPENGRHVIAECESGWDFSPRFNGKCMNYNPVDLNSLLYCDEVLLYGWAEKLKMEKDCENFGKKAEERKTKMRELCFADGVYRDYDFVNGTPSPVISCASFFPFFTGLSDDGAAFTVALGMLEKDYGVVAAETKTRNFQWAEPNGWAPLQYVAVKAAENLGLKETAVRLSEKYITATERLFEKTGGLWEKYNAITGDADVSSEYGTPEMLGWTAGVYVALKEFKESGYE